MMSMSSDETHSQNELPLHMQAHANEVRRSVWLGGVIDAGGAKPGPSQLLTAPLCLLLLLVLSSGPLASA